MSFPFQIIAPPDDGCECEWCFLVSINPLWAYEQIVAVA